MKLSYNVTGAERRALVDAISQELDAPTKYLGAPSFAYEVGGYHIDKTGTVKGKDYLNLEDALHQKGFDASEREYDEPDTYESGLGGVGATPSIEELNEETELWAEREIRRMKLESQNIPDYSNRGPYGGDSVPEPDHADGLCIEFPLKDTTGAAIDNLRRMVESKATLIKKALGADRLEIELAEELIRFPWFDCIPESEVIDAAVRLIERMLATAKSQKRVTAKAKVTGNEKYAFRCFLLRLGFIGDEYKETRKVLLQNLTGSAAFRSEAHKAFSAEDLDADGEVVKNILNKEEAAINEISK